MSNFKGDTLHNNSEELKTMKMKMLTRNSSVCNYIVKKLWLFVKKSITSEHLSAPKNITADY